MARIPKEKLELLKSALTERNQRIKDIWVLVGDIERLESMIPDVDISEYNKLKQRLRSAVLEDSELIEIIQEQTPWKH